MLGVRKEIEAIKNQPEKYFITANDIPTQTQSLHNFSMRYSIAP